MKARGHGTHPMFEGGQVSISRRFPKWGFQKRRLPFDEFPKSEVNLGKIAYLIQMKRLDPSQLIDVKKLFEAGAFTKPKCGIMLTDKGKDQLDKINISQLNLEVNWASKEAIEYIKEVV